MIRENGLVSKVLVLDEAGAPVDGLKGLCEETCLVGIRPQQSGAASVMSILNSNVDLGGIMLYENYGADGIVLARQIHASRPELPIFLRRDHVANLGGLSEKDAAMFRCAYTLADLQQLRSTLEASIFSRIYPNQLVRGITEMTCAALQSLFHDCEIDVETPYLVKDRIIYGEVFTMIPLETNWCRGYMMLQAAEGAVLSLVRHSSSVQSDGANFRELNSLLGEATNLIWGAFKNRYVSHEDSKNSLLLTQVPIVINHQRRYISFGSEDPQLCIKYTLREKADTSAVPVPILQRFVFNLNWSPDDFKENTTVESLVDAGELEIF